ncbi:uncharacterized protein LOC134250842 isoform X1 [Saccostrea cucullata]|uniref:uncharacterized protein LOC134250842 isoform X1 n=1 Tax=Saccostrea cuccullata TaxID=36930 RepID=UPI002ED3661F
MGQSREYFKPKLCLDLIKIKCPFPVLRRCISKYILDFSIKQYHVVSSDFDDDILECPRIFHLWKTDIFLCLTCPSSTTTCSTGVLSEVFICAFALNVQEYTLWLKQLLLLHVLGDYFSAVYKEQKKTILKSFAIHHTTRTPDHVTCFIEDLNKLKTTVKWNERDGGESDKYTKEKICVCKSDGAKLRKYLPQSTFSEGKRNVFGCWKIGITFLLLVLLFQVVSTQLILSCPETKDTVKYVSSCPLNMADVDQASRAKNCSSFPQNCTSLDLFKYHCLPNHYLDKFVEVCGVAVDIIYGHCAEYNEGGGVIQENYQTDCTKFSKPCPIESYSSVDTYKYADCFNITTKEIPSTTEKNGRDEPAPQNNTESPKNNDPNSNFHSSMRVLAIILGIVSPLFSLSLIIFICCRIHQKTNAKKTYKSVSGQGEGDVTNEITERDY